MFDLFFVKVDPQYLQMLSPLVKLSVAAAVSVSFETNVDQRIEWLEIIRLSTNLYVSPTIIILLSTTNILEARGDCKHCSKNHFGII